MNAGAYGGEIKDVILSARVEVILARVLAARPTRTTAEPARAAVVPARVLAELTAVATTT